MRRIFALLVLLAGFAFAEEKVDLASLPAERFLALIREPLRENAWGEFTGSIQHKSTSRRLKGILRVRITFTPEAMKAVAALAIERNTGARGLRSILEETMTDIMFELPSRKDVKKVIITEGCVRNHEKAEFLTEA